MKIENKDFACVTDVEILPISEISNEAALASNVEIKQDAGEKNLETENSAEGAAAKVPYILNGELYQILARKGENVTVRCCYCPAGRFYRGSVRSTGNFHMHIKRRHPNLLGKLHDMKVTSLLERRDRLTKNRNIKRLRRMPFKIVIKEESSEDGHKLKIKRAFQRHQAEANGSQPITTQNYATLSTVNVNESQSFGGFSIEKELKPQFDESIPSSSNASIEGNVCYDFRVRNDAATMAPEVKLSASQQSTPTPTPYPSPYNGSAFGGYSTPPPAVHHIEIEAINADGPLDLSINAAHANDEEYAADSSSYVSSGIGLGAMPSDTTVANTVTTVSAIKNTGDNHVTTAMFHNFADSNWQRLSLTLHDIHNDMNTRNRIEQNRLLLDIAKFKFLHPGFYFNLQE